ncbi:MAG TPA: glycosyltransferase [Gemmatimonadaceae bacterium]|nr:glycosyltransferase [Gemmatimonadaceae bacterium]
MKTALIFAHQCAPYHARQSTIGAQRPAQFAKYLPRFGWRAIVLCCDGGVAAEGWEADVEQRVATALDGADESSSVIIPTPRLEDAGVLDRLWQKSSSAHAGRGRTVVRKALTAARQLSTGDTSLAWLECAKTAARLVRRRERVDVCIGEHSPDAGVIAARWFADEYGTPWIADFRDPWLQPFPPTLRRLFQPRARSVLSSAAVVVNVNRRWSEMDARSFGRPTATIPNGYDPEDFSGEPAIAPDEFRVAYAGNLWREMSPKTFFEGVRQLRDRVSTALFRRFRVVYRGSAAPIMVEAARSTAVEDCLDAAGQVPREESLALLRSANVLLLLSIDTSRTTDPYLAGGLQPGKVFEYLGARRPILCVPGDKGLLDELIHETRTGTVAPTPEMVAAFLATGLEQWSRGIPVEFAPNTELVASYARPMLTERLAGLLDNALRSALPASRQRQATPA